MEIAEPLLIGSAETEQFAAENEEELLPALSTAKNIGKSTSSISYLALKEENWSLIIPLTLIFIFIGIIALLILQLFFEFNITAKLCIVIFFTAISMVAFGPIFLKNIGIFILVAIIITLILTAFIYLLYDLLRKSK
jgi:hypothetical protein